MKHSRIECRFRDVGEAHSRIEYGSWNVGDTDSRILYENPIGATPGIKMRPRDACVQEGFKEGEAGWLRKGEFKVRHMRRDSEFLPDLYHGLDNRWVDSASRHCHICSRFTWPVINLNLIVPEHQNHSCRMSLSADYLSICW